MHENVHVLGFERVNNSAAKSILLYLHPANTYMIFEPSNYSITHAYTHTGPGAEVLTVGASAAKGAEGSQEKVYCQVSSSLVPRPSLHAQKNKLRCVCGEGLGTRLEPRLHVLLIQILIRISSVM